MRSGKNSGKFIKIKSLDITEMSNIKAFNCVRYINGAGSGNRTHTVSRMILSHVRLPVPPCRQILYK